MYFLAHHKFLLRYKRKKTSIERRQLLSTAEKVWCLSIAWKVAAARTENLICLTHTRTHMQDNYCTLSASAARVMNSTKYNVSLLSRIKLYSCLIVQLPHSCLGMSLFITVRNSESSHAWWHARCIINTYMVVHELLIHNGQIQKNTHKQIPYKSIYWWVIFGELVCEKQLAYFILAIWAITFFFSSFFVLSNGFVGVSM